MNKRFVEGLRRPDLAPDSRGAHVVCWREVIHGTLGWKRVASGDVCGCSLPGLQAGGESPRTTMHSPSSRLSKVKTPQLILDAHFGVSPLG